MTGQLFEMEQPPGSDGYDPVLFGADPTPRIVAVEPGDAAMVVWRRLEDGRVEQTEEPFRPWLITRAHNPLLGVEPQELEGEGFRYLYEFASLEEYRSALAHLRDNHVEHLTANTPARLALIITGKTLFKGMRFDDIVRMQVDIETQTLDPRAQEGRILLIAVTDNRGLQEVLSGEEADMLRAFSDLVRRRDPDVLEGHNIYGFDLPYLMERARQLGVPLTIGRNGAEPHRERLRNCAIGAMNRPFVPIAVPGRHVLDTYLCVQRYDWARGALSSYGLKEVARALGIAHADRIEVPRDQMARLFREDPARIREYALQDVVETKRLAELVTPTEFYMVQMAPDTYSSSAVSGTGERINAIFLRAYLAKRHAIPAPQEPRPFPGGYTEVRRTGVIRRVVKADVESLYPSIMLSQGIAPSSDVLNVFLPALSALTARRLQAKQRMASSKGSDRAYWDGLQSSFKVLINSFYGYLGAPGFHFNDYDAAARVTEEGRRIVKQIADRLEASGAAVIEIDTDGVYFSPPPSVDGEEAERAYIESIGAALPEGIRLAFDGRYKAMVSLKTKNYVLETYEGGLIFKGSALRSRADEEFGKEFLAQAIRLLLEGRAEQIAGLYQDTAQAIRTHRIPVQKLARRERITEKTLSSPSNRRLAAAAAGVAVGEFVTVYERRDGSLGRLEDYEMNGRDENTAQYVEKLYRFACRLREAIGPDFDRLVPRPAKGSGSTPAQGDLDLFGV
ncbi:MAG: DNA polymerase domain-containing protein [Chthonomonadales bacterium]